jgi:hypothetical protein
LSEALDALFDVKASLLAAYGLRDAFGIVIHTHAGLWELLMTLFGIILCLFFVYILFFDGIAP